MLKVHKNFEIVLKVKQASVVLQDFAILLLQNSSLPLYIFQRSLGERMGIFLETLTVMRSRGRHWCISSLLIIFFRNRLYDFRLIELLVIHRAFGYSNWNTGCCPHAYLSVNLWARIFCRTVKQSLQKMYTNYFSKLIDYVKHHMAWIRRRTAAFLKLRLLGGWTALNVCDWQ